MKKVCITGLLIFWLVFLACEKKEAETAVVEEPNVVNEVKEIESVCIWDKGALRQEPTRSGKWISQMALGEKVVWTGEVSVDSTEKNRKYLKLRLSDDTEGWASEYVVETDSKPAVLIKKASIYNRPDLVTESDKKFEEMDIVALVSSEGDWLKVVGEEKKKGGWIQSNSVSTSDVNVAVALLTTKAMKEKKDEDKIEKLEAILNNSTFNSSVFIQKLDQKLNELKPADETTADVDTMKVE